MQAIRHVVLFGFKPEASRETVAEIARRFAALPAEVPGVEDFEWGVNESPEGLGRGHTHCFQMRFASEAARDAYLVHPAHRAFVDFAGPMIATATVLDYRPAPGA